MICFPKFRFIIVNPTSPLTSVLEIRVFHQLSLNKPNLFQPLSSFYQDDFFRKDARSQPSQTFHCSPYLGSQPVTPNRLGGKPPRVTNYSKSCRRESNAHAMGCSCYLTNAHTRSLSQPNTKIWLESHTYHKEMVGENFFDFGLARKQGKHTNNLRSNCSKLWSSRGIFTPIQDKLMVRTWHNPVRPPIKGG
jgi:hypothetical protein